MLNSAINESTPGKKLHAKKRIGFIHYTLPPAISGVEMVIRDHARILSTLGYKVYLLGANGKKFRSEIAMKIHRNMDPKNKRVLAIQEDLKKKKVTPAFLRLKKVYISEIKKWIDENDLSVVIAHNVLSRHYNLAFTAALTEVAAARKNQVKFITWVHDASFVDTFYTKVNLNLKEVYPWTLLATQQPDFTYITISETRKEELLQLYGKKAMITVIPNGLDINKMLPLPLQARTLFKQLLEKRPDYIGVIPVRVAERKNIEYAIELTKVAKEKYNVNLVFLVTGALHLQNIEALKYSDYLQKLIKKYALENNFFFLYNFVFPSGEKFDIYKLNIRDLYLLADFLFLPSKGEGFGLPILEAGFMRIPVFTSNLPVFKEVGNGYINVWNLEDPVENTLEKILDYLKKSRATRFHKTIIQKFDLVETVKNKVVPLLQSNS